MAVSTVVILPIIVDLRLTARFSQPASVTQIVASQFAAAKRLRYVWTVQSATYAQGEQKCQRLSSKPSKARCRLTTSR